MVKYRSILFIVNHFPPKVYVGGMSETRNSYGGSGWEIILKNPKRCTFSGI
jgi:hypothetical protein